MTLENWSDVSGLISGIFLIVTAWRNDGLYGFVEKLQKAVTDAKAKALPEDEMAPAVILALEGELTSWSWVDRWSLRGGAVFLILAFVLKLLVPANEAERPQTPATPSHASWTPKFETGKD